MKTHFSADFIQFFIDLSRNNHKDWFDANRNRYETIVKEPFKLFASDFIEKLKETDATLQIPLHHVIHRINRDIRFSKDKTPYKLKVSAMFSSTGKKNKMMPAFYLEINPEFVEIYMGAFFPDTALLNAHRTNISKHLTEFNKIIGDKKFRKVYGEMEGEDQKRISAAFKKASIKQPLLMKKEFYFYASYDVEMALKKDFLKKMVDHYKLAYPYLEFMRKPLK